MKPIFVDTSALIALGNKRDAFHLPAIRIREEIKQTNRHLVTTSAILLEFGNSFSSVTLKPIAIKFIEAISLTMSHSKNSVIFWSTRSPCTSCDQTRGPCTPS